METIARVNEDTAEFVSFLAAAQKLTTDHIAANYPQNAKNFVTTLQAEVGPRYIRVVKAELPTGRSEYTSRSAHCFIDRTNGDVLKAAGWKSPAKGARGNIFDAANGLARMGHYGPAYNR